MGRTKQIFITLMVMALTGVMTANAQVLTRANENQVRNLLQRLETRTDTFRTVLDRRMDNTRLNDTVTEDMISNYVAEFENATDDLRNNFNSRRATADDVTNVLNYGWYVDDFMRRNRMGTAPERQWNLIRRDLDRLSQYYRVSWNWIRNDPPFPQDRWARLDTRLTGTYRLNTALSDNVTTQINQQVSNRSIRDRQRENLTRRLGSPTELAIETRGNSFTMATNYGQPVTFTADGVARSETNNRGRTVTTTVTATRSSLTINTDGDRSNDFWVSFTPIGNNRLRMTRRIYLENRNEMITVNSVYDRVSDVARFPAVNQPGWNNPPNYGGFYIPNGTALTAVLRNRIDSKVSKSGDLFTMEVTSPNQYRGAIITGRLVEVESSGRLSGRANLVMDMNAIQYRGRTYSFAGIINSARERDGDVIRVNNEGTVQDGNQTTRTVTRAGIGAALGALIGAIASGGDGAAIGAAIGAGAGAGSVLIQGRDNLTLEQGTEFSITSSGPTNVGYRN